jgi:myo-inositol-1(or 4)-monophosphatase
MRSPIINVMVKAATKAARRLRRDFGEVENLQVSKKGPADFVSRADIKAEEIIREELEAARPGFSFLMEESAKGQTAPGKEPTWIVDPLDGTANFLHGLPHFAISIGLSEGGEITAGVVYDPSKEELYFAERGKGAFLNDRRLRVSGRKRLDECLVATGIPWKGLRDHKLFLAELEAAMAETAGIRRWGVASLDLAYVASGRYDGFWERDLAAWDWAAGILLVREAGGYVSQLDGRAFKLDGPSVLAANPHLHRELQKLIGKVKASA